MKLFLSFLQYQSNRYFSIKPLLRNITKMRYLNQQEAINIDLELFNECKYSVDQLMELAGLSCASAIYKCYNSDLFFKKPIVVCCGPGNNGGDGLVCARHLKMFGYNCEIYYPKQTDKQIYHNLKHQCLGFHIDFLENLPTKDEVEEKYSLIVDALFGFSFKPPIRETFIPLMEILKTTKIPIASIDIPSGWDVEKGEPEEGGIKPQMLISLTAPKMCAKNFSGKYHVLGGRFVPPEIQKKYELDLPKFKGSDCFVLLS